MKLLNLGFAPVKFILCGVPLKGIKEKGVESDYLMLSKYVPEIIIQNTHDHWGSYTGSIGIYSWYQSKYNGYF